jgi:phenylalanyl-tRNA synthetase beta chain
MRINIEYLKKFINLDDPTVVKKASSPSEKRQLWKELFASVGMETDEIIDFHGQDIFEIEVTPNRPDWLSHYGIARDLHARLPELKFKQPEISNRSFDFNNELFSIHIEDKHDCGRYTGCIVRDIEVKESSDEIKTLLESLGLRSINNIVDISNLLIMTIGHPIHMFDLDKLSGNELDIRRAKPGENITLLNEQKIDLDPDFLVIADSEAPVALAGIMGGEFSGVTQTTKNILIESAYFNPRVIRKAARKIGIKSDASFRFERGADILVTPDTINMALDMIGDSQKGMLNITYFSDPFPAGFSPRIVTLDKQYPSQYSGISIDEKTSAQILRGLGFALNDQTDNWAVEIPSFRVDIYGKQDLVEEIIRVHGYHHLTSKIPNTSNQILKMDSEREFIQKIRNHFTSIGFDEVINYIFNSPEEFKMLSPTTKPVEVRNPLGKDFSLLRQSLLPGLLKNMALNFNHSATGVRFFEFGHQFHNAEDHILEKQFLSISASGEYQRVNWNQKDSQQMDYYRFKSLILTLFRKLSIGIQMEEASLGFMETGCCFSIISSGKEIGYMGALKKEISVRYKIETPVLVAELKMDRIVSFVEDEYFKIWNKYPSYKRDISFLMDKHIKFHQLEKAIGSLKPRLLDYFHLFDRYQGQGIPEDKVSLSLSFSYTDEKRTLTNEEINSMHTDFMNKLIKKFDLIQR